MWKEAHWKKPNVEEPRLNELRYLFQAFPFTPRPAGFFYLRCSNKMGFDVPNTKGKDKNWKKEWIVVEWEWGQDYFIAGEEKRLPNQFVGELTWKKRGEMSLPKESKKILQKIKDKDYDPLGRGGDPFDQHQVDQILKIPVPTPGRPLMRFVVMTYDSLARLQVFPGRGAIDYFILEGASAIGEKKKAM
ncbi:hypothetical protein LWI29_017592 [Acer saccharum]|uniref:Uncharacterized protein n=1 Tax=Acer saccharum TaxID=4024 RepID=A0AA39S3W6_ACESA|nr:hypothetical protein LWI29_017592 [Acer saccharum]